MYPSILGYNLMQKTKNIIVKFQRLESFMSIVNFSFPVPFTRILTHNPESDQNYCKVWGSNPRNLTIMRA